MTTPTGDGNEDDSRGGGGGLAPPASAVAAAAPAMNALPVQQAIGCPSRLCRETPRRDPARRALAAGADCGALTIPPGVPSAKPCKKAPLEWQAPLRNPPAAAEAEDDAAAHHIATEVMASLVARRCPLFSAAGLPAVVSFVVGRKDAWWPVFLPPLRGRFMNGGFRRGVLTCGAGRACSPSLSLSLLLLLMNNKAQDTTRKSDEAR